MITEENKLIRTNHWNTIKCSNGFCDGELEFLAANDLNPDLNIALCPKCNRLFRLTDRHNAEELLKNHPDYLTKAEKVRLLLK